MAETLPYDTNSGMPPHPHLHHVLVFQDGMVMVADLAGEQLEDYQGRWTEKREMIYRDADRTTLIMIDQVWPGRQFRMTPPCNVDGCLARTPCALHPVPAPHPPRAG